QRVAALGELLIAFALQHGFELVNLLCKQGEPAEATALGRYRQPLHPIQPQRAESTCHRPLLPPTSLQLPGVAARIAMIPGASSQRDSPMQVFPDRRRRMPASRIASPVIIDDHPLLDDHTVFPEGQVIWAKDWRLGMVGKPAHEDVPFLVRRECSRAL